MKKNKPEIHAYHDYREFLRDWLAYKKAGQSGFSARSLAREAGIAVGYLTMVLKGERALSAKALAKLVRPLGLTASEASFLERLRTIGDSGSQELRLEALRGLQRSKSYRRNNPREFEVYRYLTHWFYVAIREMANLPEFRLEPGWIQERLKVSVPLKEVEEAVDFLRDSGHIQIDGTGKVTLPEKNIDCAGGVFRLALGKFHSEMLDLAARSIENTPSAERLLIGHALAIPASRLERAKEIMMRARQEVAALEAAAGPDEGGAEVYHLEMALFPLTRCNRPDSKERK